MRQTHTFSWSNPDFPLQEWSNRTGKSDDHLVVIGQRFAGKSWLLERWYRYILNNELGIPVTFSGSTLTTPQVAAKELIGKREIAALRFERMHLPAVDYLLFDNVEKRVMQNDRHTLRKLNHRSNQLDLQFDRPVKVIQFSETKSAAFSIVRKGRHIEPTYIELPLASPHDLLSLFERQAAAEGLMLSPQKRIILAHLFEDLQGLILWYELYAPHLLEYFIHNEKRHITYASLRRHLFMIFERHDRFVGAILKELPNHHYELLEHFSKCFLYFQASEELKRLFPESMAQHKKSSSDYPASMQIAVSMLKQRGILLKRTEVSRTRRHSTGTHYLHPLIRRWFFRREYRRHQPASREVFAINQFEFRWSEPRLESSRRAANDERFRQLLTYGKLDLELNKLWQEKTPLDELEHKLQHLPFQPESPLWQYTASVPYRWFGLLEALRSNGDLALEHWRSAIAIAAKPGRMSLSALSAVLNAAAYLTLVGDFQQALSVYRFAVAELPPGPGDTIDCIEVLRKGIERIERTCENCREECRILKENLAGDR